jgi:hypothetical protein
MDDAVDLIQQTVDVNAIPIATKKIIDDIVPDVDGGICLRIMADIALSVVAEERKIRRSLYISLILH